MKLIILSSLLAVVIAQRPGYLASGPVGYPGLANRFKVDTTSTSQNPAINNRLGERDGTTVRIPVDARGDPALVNRLNSWPRENRPFWILNADQIESHRNPQGTQSFQGNGQSLQGNNRPLQGNGQPLQGNGQAFQGNGQRFQGNGQSLQGNGQPFLENGQSFQGNGQFYPDTNQQFPSRLGTPDFLTQDFSGQVPSIPIRPVQTRGSFAGTL